MEILDKDHFVLDDGTVFYAFRSRLSISEDTLEKYRIGIEYGSDGGVVIYPNPTNTEWVEFTPKQAVEIAEYMIDLWQRFKEKYDNTG